MSDFIPPEMKDEILGKYVGRLERKNIGMEVGIDKDVEPTLI